MTGSIGLIGFDVGVPAEWDVLDLDADSSMASHRALIQPRSDVGRLVGTVEQAVAGYDAAARGLNEHGVQWAAVLAERDAPAVLVAAATLTLLPGQDADTALILAGLEVLLAAQSTEAVRRFDLPGGPAVGVQRCPSAAGPPGVTVQLYQPVPGTDLLAVLTVTSPQATALGQCSVWALTIAASLRWRPQAR